MIGVNHCMKKFFLSCCLALLIFSGSLHNAAASDLSNALAKYPPSEYGIIFGHIDTSTVDFHLSWIGVKQYPLKNKALFGPDNNSEKNILEDKLDYFWSFVKPGDYFLHEFKTQQSGMFGSSMKTSFPEPISPTDKCLRHAEIGSLTYWGGVKFIRIGKAGLLSYGQFDVQPISEYEEAALLTHLQTEAKGTAWESVIEQRLPAAQQLTAKIAAVAADAVDVPGPLRFDGLYRVADQHIANLYTYYRFFPDGTVNSCSAMSVEQPTIYDKLATKAPCGKYSVTNDQLHLTLVYPKITLDYDGTVVQNKLHMTLHSPVTKNDVKYDWRFIEVKSNQPQ